MLSLFKRKDHLVLVAMGKIKPSKSDFTDKYCDRQLIHLSALYNNLNLFIECLVQNDLNWQVKDFWGENCLNYALQGQSLDVLKYLVDRFQVDVKVTGKYGQPIWWEGFSGGVKMSEYWKPFSGDDYVNYIEFLKTQGVDFNQRETGNLGFNLGHNLLFGYKFKTLYYFLRHTNFDVNVPCRLDSGNSLGHMMAFMEDHRFLAMIKADYQHLIPSYELVISKSGNVVNDNNETVLDYLVKSGYQEVLKMYLKIKGLTLTADQYLINQRYSLERLIKDPAFCQKYGDKLFCPVEEVAPQLYSVNKREVLIAGFHQKEIQKQKVKSLTEITQSKEINAQNLYRI